MIIISPSFTRCDPAADPALHARLGLVFHAHGPGQQRGWVALLRDRHQSAKRAIVVVVCCRHVCCGQSISGPGDHGMPSIRHSSKCMHCRAVLSGHLPAAASRLDRIQLARPLSIVTIGEYNRHPRAYDPDMPLNEHSPLADDNTRDLLYAEWFRYWGHATPMLVDKSPRYSLMTRLLQHWFTPQRTYIIVLLRHPLATVRACRLSCQSMIRTSDEHVVAPASAWQPRACRLRCFGCRALGVPAPCAVQRSQVHPQQAAGLLRESGCAQ